MDSDICLFLWKPVGSEEVVLPIRHSRRPEDDEVVLAPGNRRFDRGSHGRQWINSWRLRYIDGQ
jgi:hypothetical protein